MSWLTLSHFARLLRRSTFDKAQNISCSNHSRLIVSLWQVPQNVGSLVAAFRIFFVSAHDFNIPLMSQNHFEKGLR